MNPVLAGRLQPSAGRANTCKQCLCNRNARLWLLEALSAGTGDRQRFLPCTCSELWVALRVCTLPPQALPRPACSPCERSPWQQTTGWHHTSLCLESVQETDISKTASTMYFANKVHSTYYNDTLQFWLSSWCSPQSLPHQHLLRWRCLWSMAPPLHWAKKTKPYIQ